VINIIQYKHLTFDKINKLIICLGMLMISNHYVIFIHIMSLLLMEMYKYISTYKIRQLFTDILYRIDYIYRVKHY